MKTNPKKAMRTALALARRGMGNVHPNPPVGAVIVNDREIVGMGWHQRAGGDHAEVAAIKMAGDRAKGGCMFVTLEPCAHEGKTGPCTQAIIDAGITRIHIARRDTNPVSGNGADVLRDHGIGVHEGLEATRAAHVLAGFQSMIDRGRPRITVKLATSLDGRLASGQGDSRWISNDIARAWVHRRREEADAVLIGADTAIKDNPALTARVARGASGARGARVARGARGKSRAIATGVRQPDRMVVDSNLSVSPKSRIFADNGVRRIVITTVDAPAELETPLQEKGVVVWRVAADPQGRVDLNAAVIKMGEEGYANVLCEGGGQLTGSLIAQQLADVLHLFVSPQILLGGDGPSWTEGLTVPSVARAVKITRTDIQPMGDNWMITAVPQYAQWSDPATVKAATYHDLESALASSANGVGTGSRRA